jgi:uncharacterized protein (TIGR02145 family)
MKRVFLIFGLTICYLTSFSQEKGTFTDPRDGKVYKTIKIGNQTWFAENLVYKTENGCWAYNNNEGNATKYGRLYNWETAQIVCPSGWHLPNDDEWTTLTNNLGGVIVAGGKMKATTDWEYDSGGNATNESGLNALPAGYRINSDGSFYVLGTYSGFWSSTPNESESAWSRCLSYDYGKVLRVYVIRTRGFSIRCTKD